MVGFASQHEPVPTANPPVHIDVRTVPTYWWPDLSLMALQCTLSRDGTSSLNFDLFPDCSGALQLSCNAGQNHFMRILSAAHPEGKQRSFHPVSCQPGTLFHTYQVHFSLRLSSIYSAFSGKLPLCKLGWHVDVLLFLFLGRTTLCLI